MEKDRFGDKLRDKQKADEDRYFADRDKAALEKLRVQKEAEQETTLREIAKGRCAKCGTRLTQRTLEGVEIDECGSCGGIFLDAGELERLSKREGEGWFGKLFSARS